MVRKFGNGLGRRQFLAASMGFLATPALSQNAQAPAGAETVELEGEISSAVRRNISSFRSYEWQPYFKNLKNGAILVDITSRALHHWSDDGMRYQLYPTSVP